MDFQVVPATVPASIEDWQRAMNVPSSELPPLSEQQLAELKKFRVDQEQYARMRVLLGRYAEERQREQGIQFGKIIESMIAPVAERFSLVEVSRKGAPEGWKATIRDQRGGVIEFQCLFDVVDALVSGRASQGDVQALRENIFAELGEEFSVGAAR
jgi:hypothetical protein